MKSSICPNSSRLQHSSLTPWWNSTKSFQRFKVWRKTLECWEVFFPLNPPKLEKPFGAPMFGVKFWNAERFFSFWHSKPWKTSQHSKVWCQTLELWEVFCYLVLQSLALNFGRLSGKRKNKTWFWLQTFNTPKFNTKVWSVKQKKLSALQSSTPKFGAPNKFFKKNFKLKN